MPEGPTIDPEEVLPKIVDFIHDKTIAAGRHRLILGLSGGLDSSVSAYLGVRALGKENVKAFILPHATSSRRSADDAMLVAGELCIEYATLDITPIVDAYFNTFPEADHKRRGNFMARTRMAVLYDQSDAEVALVLGTGNRTEALLGYTTLWGDMACAFTPIGGLYKTQVCMLATYLGVPQLIIDKPPSADLWEGQTDEGEMGFTYDEVDRFLYHMIDLEYDNKALKQAGFDGAFINRVRQMVASAAFKRAMPPYPKHGVQAQPDS
ncbi:MAG: NAD+ synthase [Actinomycetota bacterium]|nr:NAD+ synthase [Actinomycetota bacterium]